jgi:hypothetical protein
MPLNQKEFDKITLAVTAGKLTTKQLLALLQSEYVSKNQSRNAYDKPDRDNRSHLHVIKVNPIPENETELQKKERERGFKIRTQGESQQADEAVKKFKPKNK